MKLATLLFTCVIALAGTARADDLGAPGPAGPYAGPYAPANAGAPAGPRSAGPRAAGPARPRGDQLRRILLRRFDRDHDGRLEPRERRQALRAMRRMMRRLARQGGHAEAGPRGHGRAQALVRRFDLDHDGNIGPGEMPPAVADRLRPRDRDGDGWLDGDELP